MTLNASETDRRLGNVLQIGTVVSVDPGSSAAKVKIGDLTTPLIQVGQLSAGAIQFWWMPSVGEQVMVGAPSGDMAQATILCSVFAGNAPSSDGGVPMINLGGGKMIVNGDIEVTGDVIASGVSLVHHTHNGIALGGADTGEPNK
ncbi:phage baseplate assembly protein V [Parasedimentitalea marina]|uniref:Phage baseplate assembly protein V n=1 Tax=Parasedimentitalea marina TaxID=2483033 RepID=A0A3T0N1M1_9RHOB|nr:phage baseplate assembly protein V [Parasedimentitalea marina]AZV77889.1 phage baseplate assembly protein V [Parasedimentitalea marina]